jgi:hypothetical protein
MPNAKTAREIVIRLISGGPIGVAKAKYAGNKLKSCVQENSNRDRTFAIREARFERRSSRAVLIFSSDAQKFDRDGRGVSGPCGKPQNFVY